MAYKVGDRVKETTTTTGTGAVTLAGAVTNFVAFSSLCANADTVPYAIVHQTANEWEVGIGTWNTGGTLTRTTIISSTNANNAVNFSAGTKDVFCTANEQQVLEVTSGLMYQNSPTDGRLLVPNAAITIAQADFTGQNVNTAQPWFAAAQDTFTMVAGQTYMYEFCGTIYRASGTTSHNFQVLFGGTATFSACYYEANCVYLSSSAVPFTATRPYTNLYYGTAPSTAVTLTAAAITTATEHYVTRIHGTFTCNAGGTFIPQYKYDAAPGGTGVTKRGSYAKLTPIGIGAPVSIGAWA